MYNICFQFHITIADFELNQKDKFLSTCIKTNVKPLLIVLTKGTYINQPMFTALIKSDNFYDADMQSNKIINIFKAENFEVVRKKIEIDPKDIVNLKEIPTCPSPPYFEWHCKINAYMSDALKHMCKENDGHVSENSLENNENYKFITLREYATEHTFNYKVSKLVTILEVNNIKIIKQKFEYCIYDNKIELDKGWTSK